MKKQLIKLLSASAMIFCLTGTLISCGETSSSENKTSFSTTSEQQSSTEEQSSSEQQTTTSDPSSENPLTPSKITYRYECEDAELIDNDPGKDPLIIESNTNASNEKCVGFFRSGDVIKFTFEAEKAENNVPLTVCGSSLYSL